MNFEPKVTTEYVRKQLKDRYKDLNDEELDERIKFFYRIAKIGLTNYLVNKPIAIKLLEEVNSQNNC